MDGYRSTGSLFRSGQSFQESYTYRFGSMRACYRPVRVRDLLSVPAPLMSGNFMHTKPSEGRAFREGAAFELKKSFLRL